MYMYIYIFIVQVRCHRSNAASSLAADCNVPQCPLQKSEVLHLFRWYTHTSKNTTSTANTCKTHFRDIPANNLKLYASKLEPRQNPSLNVPAGQPIHVRTLGTSVCR